MFIAHALFVFSTPCVAFAAQVAYARLLARDMLFGTAIRLCQICSRCLRHDAILAGWPKVSAHLAKQSALVGR